MRISLTVQAGQYEGKRFEFEGHDNFIVGRSPRANLSLPDEGKHISRIHCMIELNPPQCRLIDVGSTNGTLVNGQKISIANLKDGDLITVGKTVLLVSVTSRDETAGKGAAPARLSRAAVAPLGGEFETVHVAIAAPAAMHDTTIYERPLPDFAQNGTARTRCRVCGVELPDGAVRGSGEPTGRSGALVCPECRQRVRSQPQFVPGYRLVRELGRGGLGVVYLALRAGDPAPMAVKTIKPAVPGAREDIDRFLREARLLRELSHPNIVKFHEIGEHGGVFWVAMEYVAGQDVTHLLKEQHGPLSIPRAVGLMCALLQALDHAHAVGFIHRDVKPANVLVARDGNRDVVKLADFGLTRIYQSTAMSGLTLEGDLGGSPAFMAPEQFTELRNALPAVDQYSAAAVLYFLLTARFPYDFPDRLEQKIMKILLEDPVSIRVHRPDLPDGLAQIVDRALARKPEARFASVGELRRLLVPYAR
jgi:serine/threonine-protein kinase